MNAKITKIETFPYTIHHNSAAPVEHVQGIRFYVDVGKGLKIDESRDLLVLIEYRPDRGLCFAPSPGLCRLCPDRSQSFQPQGWYITLADLNDAFTCVNDYFRAAAGMGR